MRAYSCKVWTICKHVVKFHKWLTKIDFFESDVNIFIATLTQFPGSSLPSFERISYFGIHLRIAKQDSFIANALCTLKHMFYGILSYRGYISMPGNIVIRYMMIFHLLCGERVYVLCIAYVWNPVEYMERSKCRKTHHMESTLIIQLVEPR